MATSRKKTTKKKAAKKGAKKKVSERGQTAANKKGGMTAFEATPQQRANVEYLIGLGLTHIQIAGVVINPRTGKKISDTTLREHFRDELDVGATKLQIGVMKSLYQKAMSTDHPQGATCAIFLAKTRYGLTEAQKITHEVEANSGVLIAPSTMSPEDFIAAAEARNASKKSPVEES